MAYGNQVYAVRASTTQHFGWLQFPDPQGAHVFT